MMTGQWLCEKMYTLEMHTEVHGGVGREWHYLGFALDRFLKKKKVIDESNMAKSLQLLILIGECMGFYSF